MKNWVNQDTKTWTIDDNGNEIEITNFWAPNDLSDTESN